MTDPSTEDVYSIVVDMESVRIVFVIAQLNRLLILAGDVGNAFFYGITIECVYIIAGPEFGPELCGKILIIYKALYGLKPSSARFHEHLSATLRNMGYKPTSADFDLWIKNKCDHYGYICRYVDDMIILSKDPMTLMQELKGTYTMKGAGKPMYYLGGGVIELGPEWEKEGIQQAFSAETYITNILPKLAKSCGLAEFRKFNTPFFEEYYPEVDETEFISFEKISIYKSLLGSANWIITLGRFDISYAVNVLSRYSMKPREGHYLALQRVFGYLRQRPNGKLPIDVGEVLIREDLDLEGKADWTEFYPDAEEYLSLNRPTPKGKQSQLLPLWMQIMLEIKSPDDQLQVL